MVLGLIELLLGKKKRPTRSQEVYRTGNSNNPANAYRGPAPGSSNQNINFGDDSPGLNNSNNVTNNNTTQINNNGSGQHNNSIPPSQVGGPNFVGSTPKNSGQKRPISEVLMKIQTDLKENNNKVTELVTEIKEIQNNILSLTHRVESLEENKKAVDDKFEEIDNSLGKFLSLYEVISNQYNPFVDNSESPKKVVIDAATNNQEVTNGGTANQDNKNLKPKFDIFDKNSEEGLSPLLDLDTLDIKEAAGNAVPLTRIKNDTNSLALILSWLEYMINKVGIEETRNTLRYYTEVLKWLTPEVYFELDKYLKGLRDKKDLIGNESLSIKDHIVSLYFISKLNEKPLDEKLTKAVMNMIKN